MPVGIGTPPQRLTLTLAIGDNYYSNIRVASAACDGCSLPHGFNETASSTFKPDGNQTSSENGKLVYWAVHGPEQISALSASNGGALFTTSVDRLEVVKVEHEDNLFTQQPFDGFIDLTMSAGSIMGTTKDLPSSVFSVYLKRTCASEPTDNAGVITYGGIDTVNCDATVKYVKVTPDCDPYTKRYSYVKVDQIVSSTAVVEDAWMGRLSTVEPMTLATSMFDLFNANWKATKSSDGHRWLVDCNDMNKPALTFTVNGADLSVPYEQLVTRVGDTCTLDIVDNADDRINNIVLGLPFSRQFCMVFDFPKKRIGFASKKVSDGAGCKYASTGRTARSTTQPSADKQSKGSAAAHVPMLLIAVAYIVSAFAL
ncbi:ASP-1 protein [Aphelenchoides avenae]|nr:ASP-1 protein [Aphelenchus avenae]